MRQTDPYIRDRLHDLDDLANRLLRVLTGDGIALARKELPDNAILVARNMGPAELLEYDRTQAARRRARGGRRRPRMSRSSRARSASSRSGRRENIVSMSRERRRHHRRWRGGQRAPAADARRRAGLCRQGAARRPSGARTTASSRTSRRSRATASRSRCCHNSGLVADLPMLDDTGADGRRAVPHRTAVHDREPPAAAQGAGRALPRGACGSPATGRSSSACSMSAATRSSPIMRSAAEENPAMGFRSLRLALDRPGLLRIQIRALLHRGRRRADEDPRADGHRDLGVPRRPRLVVKQGSRAADACRRAGAVQARARRDDRSALAAVRARPPAARGRFRLDRLQRPRACSSPPPTAPTPRCRKQLRSHRAAAAPGPPAHRRYGASATTCRSPCAANSPGKPIEALALMAIGMTRLSMGPPSIGPIKEMVLGLELEPIRAVGRRGARATGADGVGIRELPASEWVARPEARRPVLRGTTAMAMALPMTSSTRSRRGSAASRRRLSSGPGARGLRAAQQGICRARAGGDADHRLSQGGRRSCRRRGTGRRPATARWREMAEAEIARARSRRSRRWSSEIRILLLPKDAADEKNVILEVRGGTGGDEAALFAGDLLRMYQRYADLQGWKVTIMEESRRRSRRLQGSDRQYLGQGRLCADEVRVRRAPRAARAGDRRLGTHPHLGGDGRGAARGRGHRHRDPRPRTSASIRCARRAPAASTSTPPTRRCASRTCRPASS